MLTSSPYINLGRHRHIHTRQDSILEQEDSTCTMAKKRKRPSLPVANASPARRMSSTTTAQSLAHPVISLYYSRVASLRQYLLRLLPASSKSRRRRIAHLHSSGAADCPDKALVHLLDTTLVGELKESSTVDQTRLQDWAAWSQSQNRLQSTDTGPACPQSEVGQCHG